MYVSIIKGVTMDAKYNLSSQEYEIMSILWKENREMTLAEIADLLWDAGFEISIGTIKTYLQRIVKKGALIAPKHGHKCICLPPLKKLLPENGRRIF